ncbi:hypothetical protein SAMN06264364_10658 [Quadrisphaera granulorum]|uniref:PH (Pleckstrin Homology) domain-containing protein n=1 Tax=Quadrisphaera granulorum TaxID=317664 RepID=A0A316AA17_9ACTN|nr:hypothetical protein [Quadrisphaera granulorum]PWJ54615.1 hypothetical protein BXY45_10658 [Quadrisphaera granulorum]SZE95977.1 hypothetical protein SAMN06264364_10658 [Quadrisphaera granulorum]
MRPLLVADRRQAVRALWPALPLGGALAVLAIVLALVASSSEPSDAAIFALLVTLLLCSGRCVLWLLGPGCNGLWVDGDDVVARRLGITTRVPWSSVERVSFASAPGRPEWSTWATFERTSLRRRSGLNVNVEVLALGAASLANARRLTAECDDRGIRLERM